MMQSTIEMPILFISASLLCALAVVDVRADETWKAGVAYSLRTAPKDLVVNGDGRTNDTMPSMAVLSDGTTWMAWHAYRDRRDRVLARRIGPDGLGKVQEISEGNAINDAPMLVAAADATAWVFWETLHDGRWRLMGRQLKDDTWQTAVVLSDDAADAMTPAAVSLGDGRVLLAWSQHRDDRFRVAYRILERGSWTDPALISSPDYDSFRPAVVADTDGRAWVFWDSYRDGNYVVRGRSVLPKPGETEHISAAGAYAITPTALATRQGVCVAWLQLDDVIGGAGVVSQMHTLRMAIRDDQRWRLARDEAGGSVAATLTHGIMVKVEPRPEMKLGYMGRCRVPMLIEDGDTVWLLWDRKRNPPGHPQLSDGELVGRPFRDKQWQKPVVLHQGLVDYHVATNPLTAGRKFIVLASELPRYRRRIYHRLVADLNEHTPFQQAEWLGWRPVKLPLPQEQPSRHEARIAEKTYKLYWADLHNHGTYTCDAEGEMDELLHYARDRARIDVVCITDNDDIFDDPLTEAEYAKTTFHARRMSRAGGFLALPGYEWTSHLPGSQKIDRADPRGYDFQSRRKLGYGNDHRTVIYPLTGGPLLRHTEFNNDIRKLHKAVDAAGGLALAQHAGWTPTRHPSEAGVEVTSAWGIYLNQASNRYHGFLDRGYRYAFMGHSDSHRRNPGLGGALTGVYAEELTDKAIIDAIRQRRVFATNGSRIIVESRANGAFMGTEVRSEDRIVEVVLDVIATKPIVEATLIRDGQKLKTFSGDGKKNLHVVFNDENLPKGTHWYYWRIAQEGESPLYRGNAKVARGHLAWSSPHWVTVGSKQPAKPIERRADAPKPLPADESVKRFRLPKDLRIELVASEPLVADPSAIAWDERGRLFVCELHGYNLEGHLDVQELNKTGVLDRVVRRIPAGPQAKKAAEEETYGTVKQLIDTDGDGRMDRADVWADRLPPCLGLVAARGGVIVVCRPDIIYLADRDGDGKAEVREKLFTGFGITTLERSINNPRWGLDNWIYVAGGNAGGTITGPHLKMPVQIGTTDFRFRADGSAIEPVTGRNQTFGLTMNDWGDRFLITTRSPALYAVPLPHRYLARNPYVPSPATVANAAGYDRVYPTSNPHPWRVERSQKADWNKYYSQRYGIAESAPNGYFTAACGQMIYRADALPETYCENLFACEPAQNMIHRCLIQRDGLRFKARRAPGEEESEFLTSTDRWFRPTNLATGPDGAMYVVDMYREIIEDYSAIPRYLQQQYGLIEGKDRGRIWRIVRSRTRESSEPEVLRLSLRDTNELIVLLSHSNAWWRETSQRLLIERGDKSAVAPLRKLVQEGKTPQTRLHALYTLDGLRALELETVGRAIDDPHFAVRVHALRLSEPWLDKRSSLLEKVIQRVEDPDVRVRLQLALTLGESVSRAPSSRTRESSAPKSHDFGYVLAALVRLAARDGADQWMRAAILSSAANSADRLLAAIVRRTDDAGDSRALLAPLAAIVGARHNNEEVGELLRTIAAIGDDGATQLTCLKGLVAGLERGKPQPLTSTDGQRALSGLLIAPSAEVRVLALRVAGLVKLADSPEMKAAFDSAAREALDDDRPLAVRQAAVALLASGPYTTLADTSRRLLNPRQPLDLQLAAVSALSSADDPNVASVLLSNYKSYSPKIQAAVIDAIFSRTNRLSRLLDAIERGTISAQSIGPLHRVQLLESRDAQIRRRAKLLLAKQAPQKRRELFEQYGTALSGSRDATRGEAVFQKTCAKCHRLKGQGHQIGPDLTATSNRPDETLLLDMLQPSNQIASGFRSYVVIDTNGRVFTGVLASESATSITLRNAAEAAAASDGNPVDERTVLRKNIEELRASDQSLMPDDLHKQISPQDMADLIAFLRKTLGPVAPNVLTLFDDDRSFAELLSEGSGTAKVQTDDKLSGQVALVVTPPQRYAAAIDGWSYRIRQTPGAGEFRYIRFAWKTREGTGVMIELAAAGKWPPANQPIRRYYAGKNTTGWKATEVSPQAPTEWTVVTRDLWKEFGDFTLTGVAPTAMGGEARFDRIELLRGLETISNNQAEK